MRDGNFGNRGELLLHHKYEGAPLRLDYAQEVLKSLERIWKRPVNLETVSDGEGLLVSFDGDETETEEIDYDPVEA